MLNIFKKSNQMLSIKQFVIKNTLIALLYPVIPLLSLIIMSYTGTGDKSLMVVFSIISLCSVGFFVHLMAYYVLKKESYDDYVKSFCKSDDPIKIDIQKKSEIDFTSFKSFYFPQNKINNEYFKELAKEVDEGIKMIGDVNYIDSSIVKIDNYFKKNEYNIDRFGPEYLDTDIVIVVDGINIPVQVASLNAFLFNEQESLDYKRGVIQEKFNDKFPNNKTKDQND